MLHHVRQRQSESKLDLQEAISARLHADACCCCCCGCRALRAVEVVQVVDEVEPVDQEEEMTDRTSVEKLSWTCQSESEPYSLLLTIDVAAIEYHDHSLSSRYADKRVRVKFSGGRESE